LPETLLTVRKLTTGYGRVRAVDDISMEVAEGAIVALLGANGAGKSTLLRAVCGMVRPWHGEVLVAGQDVTGRPPHLVARLGVSLVPERRGLFGQMSVEDNLRMGCEGLDAAAMEDAVRRGMGEFPVLEHRRRQRAATLSGGEQQMLAIARGLCRRPRLLLLDEMSQGLAPMVVAELFGRIDAIRRSGTAVLLVEQYAAAALDVADDIYVIEKGRIVFHGTPAQLRSDERAMREAYLGSAESVGRLRNGAGDRPTEEVVIRISPRLRRRYERLAAELGTTVGDQVRGALAAHLETMSATASAGSRSA
jgi:branched-chain amino acid transport system ATP-binding protein